MEFQSTHSSLRSFDLGRSASLVTHVSLRVCEAVRDLGLVPFGLSI